MKKYIFLFSILVSVFGTKAMASDIVVANADGVNIYYDYINDGKELEVAKGYYKNDVVIPENVTYMNRTRKVTSIGYRAFYEMHDLSSVTIPNSVINIGEAAFAYCYKLVVVNIGNNLESIGSQAFAECRSLNSITIPNSVTSIGSVAFLNCQCLTSITIPNGVTSIESATFTDCQSLTSVTIPNTVTSIGFRAFQGCTSLASITIPNSVTIIGNIAFAGCTNLTSITIPNSVTYISNEAFKNCTNLTSLTIGNSVTTIGNGAFSGSNISTVTSLINNPFAICGNSSEERTFSKNTFNNATLYVPFGTIDKYRATEGWKDFLFIEESSPSSIKEIDNEDARVSKCYTIDGRVIKDSHRGIIILRMNNGKSKKLVKR